jgi:hypothetical protein
VVQPPDGIERLFVVELPGLIHIVKPGQVMPTPFLDLTAIEYTYIDHNCAVIGGYVYRGTTLPDLVGKCVFGDYCSGKIWTLTDSDGQWAMTLILQSI